MRRNISESRRPTADDALATSVNSREHNPAELQTDQALFEVCGYESPDVLTCLPIEAETRILATRAQSMPAQQIPVFDAPQTMFVARNHFGQTRPPPFEEVARPPR